jgi:hypothetical protein
MVYNNPVISLIGSCGREKSGITIRKMEDPPGFSNHEVEVAKLVR